MNHSFRVGIIGATGYVGQRFVTLLDGHPWFKVTQLAASERSAGLTYEKACENRWKMTQPIPEDLRNQIMQSTDHLEDWIESVDFVFCAVDMKKDDVKRLEERIAKTETPVVSNNSANRMIADVPMIVPEINPDHTALIEQQRHRLGTRRGFIIVKPNCSIQSYVPALTPLMKFEPVQIIVSTYQAVSGAGKTLSDWPEMQDNMIPYIGGEEEKSEHEPLKIWGTLSQTGILMAAEPVISAQCYRVAVQEGHTAAVSVRFRRKPGEQEILDCWSSFRGYAAQAGLPSAPDPFLIYRSEQDRPQPSLDSMAGNGMAITIGRLRPDPVLDWKFTCLSSNTIRGAAGGGILSAELLVQQGYLSPR